MNIAGDEVVKIWISDIHKRHCTSGLATYPRDSLLCSVEALENSVSSAVFQKVFCLKVYLKGNYGQPCHV